MARQPIRVESFQQHIEAFKSKVASGYLDSAESLVRAHSELEDELQDDSVYQTIVTECDDSVELWETVDYENLLMPAVVTYKELVHTAIENSKQQHLEGQFSLVSDQLEKLKEKYKLLEKRIKEFEACQLKRKTGQLALEINRAVVHKVLEGIVDPDEEQINTIGDMEKAFKGKSNFDDIFENEEDMKKAKEKWETLKKEIKWKGVYFRYLKKLKYNHINTAIARPTFDLQEMKQALTNGTLQMPDAEMQLLKECLIMYEILHTPQ